MRVVVDSSGVTDVEPALTLDGPDVVGTVVVDSPEVEEIPEVEEVEPALTLDGPDTVGAVVVEPAVHLVQIVDVEVRVTVETVLVGMVRVEPPRVTVCVTGQVVTVV